MKTLSAKQTATAPLNVLLVGNNPIDMGDVLVKLKEVRTRRLLVEIAFDSKSVVERLSSFDPDYIFIDDNVGREELHQIVCRLGEQAKTKNTPITVLKNSNYRESLGSYSILDYLLKQNLSGESMYNAIRNALRFRKTQRLLYNAYQEKTGLLKKLVERVTTSAAPALPVTKA